MVSSGFEETEAHYQAKDSIGANVRIGEYRRFGELGPAYEVVRMASRTHASVRVVYSGEELDYRLDRLLQDPTAVTRAG